MNITTLSISRYNENNITSSVIPTPTPGKAIFGYGISGVTNLVSNTGVVATDTTGVGTGRIYLAATGYSTDKAIFGYGFTPSGALSITNLVSNTGVVATDTTGVGSTSYFIAAARFGGV